MHSLTTSTASHCKETSAGADMANKARFWNRIAHKYASDPIADLAGYVRTLHRLQILLSSDHEVLEISSGTCIPAPYLTPGIQRPVTRDVAETMIAIACAKLARQTLPQLHFKVADTDVNGAEQGTFDTVLVFNLLHLVKDLPQALHPALEAVKPDELGISKTPCRNEMNSLTAKLIRPLLRAIGKGPSVLCFNTAQLQAAMSPQGLDVHSIKRQSNDIRIFIVIRRSSL